MDEVKPKMYNGLRKLYHLKKMSTALRLRIDLVNNENLLLSSLLSVASECVDKMILFITVWERSAVFKEKEFMDGRNTSRM